MSARFCLLIVQLGLVALILSPRQSLAQGIGLPGQSGDKPIEIKADDGIEWQQKNKAYICKTEVFPDSLFSREQISPRQARSN